MRAALALVLIASCVRSAAVDCGNGTLCAADQACLLATTDVTVCVPPALLGTCDADGDECGDHGRCYAGACLPITCGDRLADPKYEQCDDGNVDPGDGCSADCASTEMCGNGVVDPIHGEQCDDGNPRSFDGCDATCAPERMEFSPIVVDVPSGNAFPGLPGKLPMAYMPSQHRVIALADGSQFTWQWNGAGWVRAPLDPALAPTLRHQGSMVYDPDTQRVLLFGGLSSGIDLWEWNGVRWRLLDVSAPDAGDEAAAYDAGAHVLLVFGGLHGVPGNGATQSASWSTWDGAHWTTPELGGPSARQGAAMAYDATRDRVVLFGGDHAGTALAETWQWHAGVWTKLTPAMSPPARVHAALFPDGNGLVLFGGTDAGGGALADAWRWDGQTWTPLGPQAPGARAWPSVAVDTDRHRAVMSDFNGAETWEWDGAAWTKSVVYLLPNANLATGVWDAARMRPIAVTDSVVAEVKDGVWIPLGPGAVPLRHGGAIFYDRANDRIVQFGGGDSGNQFFGDTQVAPLGAAGVTWSTIATTGPVPTARIGAAAAYDERHANAVVFGGNDAGTIYDDTWVFDGAWHAVTPAIAPTARSSAAIAYDPVRREVIMFGGKGKAYLDETWRWDGSTWTLLAPPAPIPPPRFGATLTWNPASQKLTLYGGAFGGQLFSDVWEWDGARWTEQPATTPPPPRLAHLAMAASDQTGIVVYGGATSGGVGSDEFSLGWRPLRP